MKWISVWAIIGILHTTSSILCAHADFDSMNLDSYLNQRGCQSSPVYVQINGECTSQKERDLFVERLEQLPGLKCIAEVGFNSGHTSEVFLEHSQGAQVVSFDAGMHPCTRLGVEFIQGKYKDRFRFIEGDSLVTVPRYFEEHPGQKFDLIFIDGRHSCLADIRDLKNLAHKNTILWIDEYDSDVFPGIKKTVDSAEKLGIIRLTNTYTVEDVSGRRVLAEAVYVFDSQAESIFNNIYRHGVWGRDAAGQGCSGGGSIVENALPYIRYVNDFLAQHDIKTVVDLGCGDWVLGKEIAWGDRDYTGLDVASDIIKRNSRLYGSNKVHFKHLDGTRDALPAADLLICKDVLAHLSYVDIFNILCERAKFKFIIFVSDVVGGEGAENQDTSTGGYRPVHLKKSPFNLVPCDEMHYESGWNIKEIILLRGA